MVKYSSRSPAKVVFTKSGVGRLTVQLWQFSIFFHSDFTKVLNETLDNALEALISAQEQVFMEFQHTGLALDLTGAFFYFFK